MDITILSTLLRPLLTGYFSMKYWETGDINTKIMAQIPKKNTNLV